MSNKIKTVDSDSSVKTDWYSDSTSDSDVKPKVIDSPDPSGDFIDGVFYRPKGMHWVTTALFILGDVAGGGLVSLPVATVRTSK